MENFENVYSLYLRIDSSVVHRDLSQCMLTIQTIEELDTCRCMGSMGLTHFVGTCHLNVVGSGSGLWEWALGVGSGRGLWAWALGVGSGRGLLARALGVGASASANLREQHIHMALSIGHPSNKVGSSIP